MGWGRHTKSKNFAKAKMGLGEEHQYKERPCLNCGRTFLSWGWENRKCEKCKYTERFLGITEVEPAHCTLSIISADKSYRTFLKA